MSIKAASKNLTLSTVSVLLPLLYISLAKIGIKPKAADDNRAYIIPFTLFNLKLLVYQNFVHNYCNRILQVFKALNKYSIINPFVVI